MKYEVVSPPEYGDKDERPIKVRLVTINGQPTLQALHEGYWVGILRLDEVGTIQRYANGSDLRALGFKTCPTGFVKTGSE